MGRSRNPFTKDDLLRDYWGLVDTAIDRFGSKEFIVTKNGSVTFHKAVTRAELIRHYLLKATTQKQIGVGIFLQDPREVIPCMIGVLKAGNYFIVMDVSFPAITLKEMMHDAEIKVILTTNLYISVIQPLVDDSVKVINIDQIDDSATVENLPVEYSPEDFVQVMFTSGSTGKPKGAIEDYRYLVRAVHVKLETYEFNDDDKILQLSSFTFSGHHTFVFTALLVGLTICYHPVKVEGFSTLADWMKEKGITIFTSTPTTFRSLASVLTPQDTFPLVHTFYLGGDKRLRNDILIMKRHFPNVKWVRINYSGTEMQTVASSLVPIETVLAHELVPSGKPCDDLRVYIWDTNGKELPQGQEGEIVIYGDGLARGYINNPELSSKKFIQDTQHTNWQYLKTGDLGKFLPDGQLMHLGRIDNMVKIKGVRIEMDSIENRVLSYPGVIHAASKVFDDGKGIKRLVMYYTAENGIHIPVADLRRHLSEIIPMQQIPSYFISMEKLPLTPTGKVDHEKLPFPSLTRPPLDYPYTSPSSKTEHDLVAIWEEQIGVTGIGVMDDFFDIGGDSLLGAIIFVEIEKILGISLPVSTLLTAQNIRDLAKIIDGKTSFERNSPIIAINPYGGKTPIFFIPGKGGFPTRISHLARWLDPEFPLYAFQNPVGISGVSEFKSIEQIASVFENSLSQITSDAECILIGESLGGKIAYEIAQQMARSGKHMPIVFLLDTYNDKETKPDFYQDRNKWLYYRMIAKKHAFIWLRSNWTGKKEYLKFYRETFRESFSEFFNRWKRKQKTAINRIMPEKHRIIENNLIEISRNYTIKPYAGKIVLVIALRGSKDSANAHGWDKVGIKDLVIEPLDCYHGSMLFEPAVSELAEIIQKYGPG
jgi:amino acid adenylation domain-containing protein